MFELWCWWLLLIIVSDKIGERFVTSSIVLFRWRNDDESTGVVVVVEGPSVLYWRPRTAAGPGVGLLLRLPYICHKEDQLLLQECNLSLSSWKQGQIFFVEGIFVKDENMYLAEGHVANNQNHQETFLVNTDSALCSNT